MLDQNLIKIVFFFVLKLKRKKGSSIFSLSWPRSEALLARKPQGKAYNVLQIQKENMLVTFPVLAMSGNSRIKLGIK